MNLPTIAELRARAGVPDNSKDTQLQAAYDLAFALIEDYLDRKLKLAVYTEKFLTRACLQLVKAWPIASVDKIAGNIVTFDETRSDMEKGMLFLNNSYPIEIEYQGGYAPTEFPEILVTGIGLLFDYLWDVIPGFGTAEGAATSAGDVKRFTINGITMEYFGDNTASGSGSKLSGWSSANIPEYITMLVDRYRRESVIGIG